MDRNRETQPLLDPKTEDQNLRRTRHGCVNKPTAIALAAVSVCVLCATLTTILFVKQGQGSTQGTVFTTDVEILQSLGAEEREAADKFAFLTSELRLLDSVSDNRDRVERLLKIVPLVDG